MATSKKVKSGLDLLVADGFSKLRGDRVAILAHAASVDTNLNHIADLIHTSGTCKLIKIFAPEHGFRGALQDMASVSDYKDAKTGVPVISLYGKDESSLAPQAKDLQDVDTIVIDLQDVGSRYYTFVQTMVLVMKVASTLGKRVVVVDRPNPIGGSAIEGAPLDKSCRSFCGFAAVANRHGLSIGELAKLYQAGFGEGSSHYEPVKCTTEIIPMENWNREMYFDETGLPWVLPSPNMPTLDTALVYPGGCLFEATTVSEGRGTTRPFEFTGAPYVDPFRWIEETMQTGIGTAGVALRPMSFIPGFQKHKGEDCQGVQIHITDRKSFKPFRLGLNLLFTLARLNRSNFKWRGEAFEFVKAVPAIDLLYGSPKFRSCVEGQGALAELLPEIEQFESWYSKARKPFLLY